MQNMCTQEVIDSSHFRGGRYLKPHAIYLTEKQTTLQIVAHVYFFGRKILMEYFYAWKPVDGWSRSRSLRWLFVVNFSFFRSSVIVSRILLQ